MSVLPNPETPLAFLPKDVAQQYEVSRYLYVATLGAFVWDILTHVPEEYRLLFKQRFSLPTFVYFFSRTSALAYLLTSTIFQVAPVPSCQGLQVALGWCFVAAVSSTSFLFFLRVRAIFEQQKYIIAFFTFMWLCVLGGTITVPFSIQGGHIGTTRYCINTAVKPYASAGIIISSVNDALVLFAISWRVITTITYEDTFNEHVKSFFGRRRLPALSQAVLQSGQQYYAITVGSNILTLVMILTPSVPPVYHAMFTIPNVALMNAMACLVFRNIRFGIIDAELPTLRTGGLMGNRTLPLAFRQRPMGRTGTTTRETYTLNDGLGTELSKTLDPMDGHQSRAESADDDMHSHPKGVDNIDRDIETPTSQHRYSS